MSLKNGNAVIKKDAYHKLKRAQLMRVYKDGNVRFVYDRLKGEEKELDLEDKTIRTLIEERFYWMGKDKGEYYEYERKNARFYFEAYRLGIKEDK